MGGSAAAAPCLEFRGVTFEIPLRGGGTKRILSDVSGWCAPGAVTALSGPSGGGKTTLLDALGSCIYGGRLAGTVLVDGTPADVWRAQPGHTAAYVQQHVSALPACRCRCSSHAAGFHPGLSAPQQDSGGADSALMLSQICHL